MKNRAFPKFSEIVKLVIVKIQLACIVVNFFKKEKSSSVKLVILLRVFGYTSKWGFLLLILVIL
jgi:hypothetical protein